MSDQPAPPRGDARSAARRFNFTEASLSRLRPGPKRVSYYDSKAPRLALLVTPSGAKSFYFVKSVDGKSERLMIGRFPDLTIKQARALVTKYTGEVAWGRNPVAERRQKRATSKMATVGTLFKTYVREYAKPHKRSWREDERQYKAHLEQWADRPIEQITSDDVRKLHQRIGKDAPVAANRLLALISKLYNFADESDVRVHNPAKGVKKFRETSRERFLERHELGAFLRAIDDEPNEVMRDYLLMLLLTGQRRRNVAAMKWADVRLDDGLWTIPAEESRTGRQHLVPLSSPALEILRRRRDNSESEYVFPGRLGGHLAEPKTAMDRIAKAAGVGDLTVHDLRRTFSCHAVRLGINPDLVEFMHGFAPKPILNMRRTFDVETMRGAYEQVAAHMLAVKLRGSS